MLIMPSEVNCICNGSSRLKIAYRRTRRQRRGDDWLNKPVVLTARRVHPSLQQRLVLRAAKKAKHECIARLKTVAEITGDSGRNPHRVLMQRISRPSRPYCKVQLGVGGPESSVSTPLSQEPESINEYCSRSVPGQHRCRRIQGRVGGLNRSKRVTNELRLLLNLAIIITCSSVRSTYRSRPRHICCTLPVKVALSRPL